MKLEVVVVPVADVDRAKNFYKALGWREDADFAAGADFRVAQLTPPGSACSIIFGTGVTSAAPGSTQGLQLVVADIDAAQAELAGSGAEVSEVFHDAGGVFHHAGTEGRVAGPDPDHKSYGSFASFSDPDGNGWLLQEITTRIPGRRPGPGPGDCRPGRADSSLQRRGTSMQVTFDPTADRAASLRRPAAPPGRHEEQIGHADPDWYAQYIEQEQAGRPGQARPRASK